MTDTNSASDNRNQYKNEDLPEAIGVVLGLSTIIAGALGQKFAPVETKAILNTLMNNSLYICGTVAAVTGAIIGNSIYQGRKTSSPS